MSLGIPLHGRAATVAPDADPRHIFLEGIAYLIWRIDRRHLRASAALEAAARTKPLTEKQVPADGISAALFLISGTPIG
jgi:hypothetical protein